MWEAPPAKNICGMPKACCLERVATEPAIIAIIHSDPSDYPGGGTQSVSDLGEGRVIEQKQATIQVPTTGGRVCQVRGNPSLEHVPSHEEPCFCQPPQILAAEPVDDLVPIDMIAFAAACSSEIVQALHRDYTRSEMRFEDRE